MFVVTSEGVLLYDAQGDPEATRKEVEAISKITTHPIKWVVIASDHGDHTGGNSSLPVGVTFFIHPNSKAILDKQAANAKRPPSWTLPADAVLVPEKKALKPGSEDVEILFLGRSHTGGDLAVYLPRQKILFLSEIFFNRVFPAMWSAYPSEWLKALDRAEEIAADVYIPGHGFTEKAAVSKEELYEYHRALKAVIDEATRLYKAGVPVEEAVKPANWASILRGRWRARKARSLCARSMRN